MTNKERLQANNAKIEEIQKILNNKMLKAQGKGDYFVKVIDYDGTILKEANLNAGDTFELPTPPSHDGLVFQEWSCSQDIIDNVITIEDNNVMVGAIYTTESGLNEFDIEITKAMEPDISTNGFVVTLNMDGTKNWGDGTSDDLTTHTYSAYGEYTIKCNGTTIGEQLFGQSLSVKNYYCKRVRFGNITNAGGLGFCDSLVSVSMPNTVTSIGSFRVGNALDGIVIPVGVTSIGYECFFGSSVVKVVLPKGLTTISGSAFYQCKKLEYISIPETVTSISSDAFSAVIIKKIKIPSVPTLGSNSFSGVHTLKDLKMSNGITTIASSCFQNTDTLREIKFPSTITRIYQSAFASCEALVKYDFSEHTTIPTLSNTSAFSGINTSAKIIVPDNLYDEWIVATNWSTFANYIYKASEVQE